MKSSYILGVFGVICLLGAAIFSSDVSEVETKILPGEGGIFGPLMIKEKNSSYEVTLKNYVALNKWSHIEVEVLDANKNYLFGFGDDMWHESGRDSDGAWVESKTDYSMDITFKEPGEYYLNVGSERNDGKGGSIAISAVKKRGSNIAFLTIGVVSLIFAVITYYSGTMSRSSGNKKGTRNIILIVVLIMFFILALIYSMRGWGYMGYYGYHRGPSFFYMGGPGIYHQPSNREGSISGTGHRGGGFSGGK